MLGNSSKDAYDDDDDDDDDDSFTIHKRQLADSRYLRRAPLSKGGQTQEKPNPSSHGPSLNLKPQGKASQRTCPRRTDADKHAEASTLTLTSPCPALPNSHQSPRRG